MQVIDGASLDSDKDVLLLVGLGALVLVGAFASELAGESWRKVQDEVKADELRRRLEVDSSPPLSDETPPAADVTLGPINLTSLAASALEAIPAPVRKEGSLVWAQLDGYCSAQWAPAATAAVSERLRRREEAAALQAATTGADDEISANRLERLLSSLATPAEGGEGGAPPRGEGETSRAAESAAEVEARLAQAEWALAGPQPLRGALSSLLFSFVLIGALKKQWEAYPLEREQLNELVGMDTAALVPMVEEENKESK